MTHGITTSVVMSVFLLLTSVIFLFLTSSWTDQSFNTAEVLNQQWARLESEISVKSTAQSAPEACDTYTAQVENTGEVAIDDFGEMDVLVEYTDTSSAGIATRLAHADDWSVTAISPDSRDLNTWNPAETATITFTLSPAAKDGTSGNIVVVTALGISDVAYFTCTIS